VSASGLRGRGGAGFPTGRKWSSIADAPVEGGRRYVVVNGAEGEPATFKDRALMRANPYQLVEGAIIAAFAVGADEVYIGVKRTFETEITRLTQAVEEMQQAGICRDCQVTLVHGPEEYLYGEETGLLEVIEGKPPLPRLFRPYEHGLFASDIVSGWQPVEGVPAPNPTLVNNVETLSNVPWILARGADWFRSMGTAESPGNVVCTVVGDVVRPGVAEIELGTSLGDAIAGVAGGVQPGRTIKAVFSGVSNPVVTRTDIPISYEGFTAAGSSMGAVGYVVYDDTACMVEVARLMSRFLYVESCGQCPPCKLGSAEMTTRLERIEAGVGADQDIDVLRHWIPRVTDGNRCYLAVEEQSIVSSIMREFAGEFAEHLEGGRCPRPRTIPLPKIVDMNEHGVVYDERQYFKQPDWTYVEG
jgi:NADH:ubiquinone oxidoreductase subunit F (NADH-binding)